MKNQLNTETDVSDSVPVNDERESASLAGLVAAQTTPLAQSNVTLTACGLRVVDDDQAQERWF
ncbi:MAG: hypothetical protein AB7D03_02445 [Thiomicrospira sp.]